MMFWRLIIVYSLISICSIKLSTSEMTGGGHIVLISPPLLGHIIPLLDLGKRLSVDHDVTYVVSASKIATLKQYGFLPDNQDQSSHSTQSKLKIVALADGNNEDYEVINRVTNVEIQKILDRMHQPLLDLLFVSSDQRLSRNSSSSSVRFSNESLGRPIDLIICDLFILSPILEAYKRNLTTYIFLPNSLLSFTNYLNRSINSSQNNQSISNFDRQLIETVSLTKGIICNSIFELEESVLNDFRQKEIIPISNVTILFVAPLLSQNQEQKRYEIMVAFVKEWLDRQWERENKSSSVIYISFGSWSSFEMKQLFQIASVLKDYSFIWSLKSKWQRSISSSWFNHQKHLFLDWAPQTFILSHPALRLFLSHGGWNSLIEAMNAAIPTLVWPLLNDQISNGFRLEYQLRMGRCIQNTFTDNHHRIVTSEELRRYIKGMFTHHQKYLEKAKQVKQMFTNAKDSTSKRDFEQITKTISSNKHSNEQDHYEF